MRRQLGTGTLSEQTSRCSATGRRNTAAARLPLAPTPSTTRTAASDTTPVRTWAPRCVYGVGFPACAVVAAASPTRRETDGGLGEHRRGDARGLLGNGARPRVGLDRYAARSIVRRDARRRRELRPSSTSVVPIAEPGVTAAQLRRNAHRPTPAGRGTEDARARAGCHTDATTTRRSSEQHRLAGGPARRGWPARRLAVARQRAGGDHERAQRGAARLHPPGDHGLAALR